MALRARKRDLITSLHAKAIAYGFGPDQVDTFERLYRGARTEEEQNEITRALDFQTNGWKTGSDAFSRVLQAASDIGELGDEPDDDEDSPAMKAALERSQVTFRR